MTDHQRYRFTMWFAAAVIIHANLLLGMQPTLAQNATENTASTQSAVSSEKANSNATANANNKNKKQTGHTPSVTVQSVQAIPLENTTAQKALKPKDAAWWQSKLPKAGAPATPPRRHAADKQANGEGQP